MSDERGISGSMPQRLHSHSRNLGFGAFYYNSIHSDSFSADSMLVSLRVTDELINHRDSFRWSLLIIDRPPFIDPDRQQNGRKLLASMLCSIEHLQADASLP